MGQFLRSPKRPRKKRISRFRFQNSHLMRCTERFPDFWYFVGSGQNLFSYPLTACKVNHHHPFAVESENGTHRALMHAFPSDGCAIFYIYFLLEVGYLTHHLHLHLSFDDHFLFSRSENPSTTLQVCNTTLPKRQRPQRHVFDIIDKHQHLASMLVEKAATFSATQDPHFLRTFPS